MINEIKEIARVLAPAGEAVQQTALAYIAADIATSLIVSGTLIGLVVIVAREIRGNALAEKKKELEKDYTNELERAYSKLPKVKLYEHLGIQSTGYELNEAMKVYGEKNSETIRSLQHSMFDSPPKYRKYLTVDAEKKLIEFLRNN